MPVSFIAVQVALNRPSLALHCMLAPRLFPVLSRCNPLHGQRLVCASGSFSFAALDSYMSYAWVMMTRPALQALKAAAYLHEQFHLHQHLDDGMLYPAAQ